MLLSLDVDDGEALVWAWRPGYTPLRVMNHRESDPTLLRRLDRWRIRCLSLPSEPLLLQRDLPEINRFSVLLAPAEGQTEFLEGSFIEVAEVLAERSGLQRSEEGLSII